MLATHSKTKVVKQLHHLVVRQYHAITPHAAPMTQNTRQFTTHAIPRPLGAKDAASKTTTTTTTTKATTGSSSTAHHQSADFGSRFKSLFNRPELRAVMYGKNTAGWEKLQRQLEEINYNRKHVTFEEICKMVPYSLFKTACWVAIAGIAGFVQYRYIAEVPVLPTQDQVLGDAQQQANKASV